MPTCTAGGVATTNVLTFGEAEYTTFVEGVIAAYDALSGQDQVDFASCHLRAAGHDLMDF